MDIQLAINPEDMEVVLDIPELSQEELEARRRAVTLVEVDNPQLAPQDDWFTPSETDLPRVTVEEFGSGGLLPAVDQDLLPAVDQELLPTMDQDLLPTMDQELGSFLPDEDLSAMMPPPPVRPTSTSDPHVEVTPSLQEEKKRKSPRQPAEDIANPGNLEDLNPPDIVVDPPAEVGETEGLGAHAIIQPPPSPVELPDSFELPEVSAKPPKKKRRKLGRLCVDETTQLSMDSIKSQLADFSDLQREREFPATRGRTEQQLTSGPGRALKGGLASFWEGELAATRRFAQDNFDWSEEAAVEEEMPEVDLLQIPDDVSEIRAHGAAETIGEANLSSADNVEASTVNNNNILPDLELPPEVELQGVDELPLPLPQDPPVFPELLGSPERVGQLEEGPMLPLSPLLADQLDLLARPDDSVVSSSVLDQVEALLQSGEAKTFPSIVDSVGPSQPTRRDVAVLFRSLLVLEKREEIQMDQEEEEDFYATISVTKL